MRVILAGQRSFGAAVYEMLRRDGHEVAAVWSPVDASGRPDPLTQLAVAAGEFAPPWQRTPEQVAQLGAHLFVCAHSHDFISRKARLATQLGGVGYHPSLLPLHRGRDAVRWTIHMNERIAGGSVYWLTDSVDAGPIAAQRHCFVRPGWDASDLWRRELFPLGIKLLRGVLRDLERGVIVEVPQDESLVTWEPSWERPPLFRPDLIQIGKGVNGFTHRVHTLDT